MSDLVVVINHYEKDIKWIDELNHKYVIYCKNPKCYGKYDYDLPNYGFDTIVYLKYIIDNYDSLPQHCCFSQDDPFDHCGGFLREVNNFDSKKKFIPLGRVYKRDNQHILTRTKIEADKMGIKYTEPILFVSGAQCIVSKERIRSQTKQFWEALYNKFPEDKPITNYNYTLEYLWPQLFNSQHDIEHLVK